MEKIDLRTATKEAKEDIRKRAIRMIKQGHKLIEVARILGVNKNSVTTWYSNYRKYKASSGIKNTEAMESGSQVGHGLDFALKWRVFSDLSAFLNYAFFIPGSAYKSSASSNQFFMLGANLSF